MKLANDVCKANESTHWPVSEFDRLCNGVNGVSTCAIQGGLILNRRSRVEPGDHPWSEWAPTSLADSIACLGEGVRCLLGFLGLASDPLAVAFDAAMLDFRRIRTHLCEQAFACFRRNNTARHQMIVLALGRTEHRMASRYVGTTAKDRARI